MKNMWIVVTIALVLVTVGTVAFHIWSPWWFTPIASNWGFIDDTIVLTFWVTGVVFIAILLFMAYCVMRFRYKEGHRSEYEPENTKLEVWLSVLTGIGVVIMLAPGLFAWNQFITVPEGADRVEVMGQQWQWSYRYPGADGVLGTTSATLIDEDNTFGVNTNDANGLDDILIEGDELHLPLGRPVKILLRSIDVLHDFYVPQFRAKMDMVPGTVTYIWLTPTRIGTFDILCFELCGIGHYNMRSTVVVEEEADYQAWLQEQSTFAEIMAEAGRNLGSNADVRLSENTDLSVTSTVTQ
jgi:cytochrome c oxidase subunit 2